MSKLKKRIAEENDSLWEINFHEDKQDKLASENGDYYYGKVYHDKYHLKILKKNLFAWITVKQNDKISQDFRIVTAFSFDKNNGHSAAGFVLRYLDDKNFYYLLLSSKKLLRFDVIINGTIKELLGWTAFSALDFSNTDNPENELQIVVSGSRFVLVVNDEWVADIVDETIRSNGVGIAAQNYNEREQCLIKFSKISFNSDPISSRKWFERWMHIIPKRTENIRIFIQSMVNAGSFSAAEGFLEKLNKANKLTIQERLLLVRVLFINGQYDKAESEAKVCLIEEPENFQVRYELAKLSYARGEYNKVVEFTLLLLKSEALVEAKEQSTLIAKIWNLKGNAEFELMQFNKAGKSYELAVKFDPNTYLFHINLAKTLEQTGRTIIAKDHYLIAARLLFDLENYDECEIVLSTVSRIFPDNKQVILYKAKVAFSLQDYVLANKLINYLIKVKECNTEVNFLKGLLLIKAGKRMDALSYLKNASVRDKNNDIYWFRYAECLYLLEKPFIEEARNAVIANPNHFWSRNLYAEALKKKSRYLEAELQLEKALVIAPNNIDITINMSHILIQQGKFEEAIETLNKNILKMTNPNEENQQTRKDQARLQNQKGNILINQDSESALIVYEKALVLVPDDADFLENTVGACILNREYNRAEELLPRLLDERFNSDTLNLSGIVALRVGDIMRAEAAFLEAIKIEPNNTKAIANLGELFLDSGRYHAAKLQLPKLKANKALYKRLLKKIESKNK